MRNARNASTPCPVPSSRTQEPVAVDDQALRRLFRSMVIACASGSFLLGAAACSSGGSAAKTGPILIGDGGISDAGSCQPATCTNCSTQCGPGCLTVSTCVDGSVETTCNCDAGLDAGLSCTPLHTSNYYIPISCFDATPTIGTTPACAAACGSTTVHDCDILPAAGGVQVLGCFLGTAAGRRPAGFRHGRRERAGVVGDYFARVTELEAASVTAFRTLKRELLAHGAPEELVALAEQAARDEVRHTRMMGSLANRHGVKPAKPRARARGTRPLETIALENAVEGCVREAYAALTTTYQASAARDPKVRAIMSTVAVDETRHAALSMAVARWADASLDDAARARVAAARDQAIRRLEAELDAEPTADLRAEAGLPDAARAKALLAGMKQALWAA